MLRITRRHEFENAFCSEAARWGPLLKETFARASSASCTEICGGCAGAQVYHSDSDIDSGSFGGTRSVVHRCGRDGSLRPHENAGRGCLRRRWARARDHGVAVIQHSLFLTLWRLQFRSTLPHLRLFFKKPISSAHVASSRGLCRVVWRIQSFC